MTGQRGTYSRLLAPASASSGARRLLVKAANRGLRRLPQRWPAVDYTIDGFSLHLPLSHPLPRILATDPQYQRPLRALAESLAAVGLGSSAVDIGANVGDTAAVMSMAGVENVVCVEGSDVFLPFLYANASRASEAGWHWSVTPRFVESGTDVNDVRTGGGTASLVVSDAPDQAGVLSFITIDELFDASVPVSILKIDTDGMDVAILGSVLRSPSRPQIDAIFFEFTPSEESVTEVLDDLGDTGFTRAFWFDHAGEFLCSHDLSQRALAAELSDYGRRIGTYFDIATLGTGVDATERFAALVGAAG
jgi:FkbM family methyltransferase